MIRSGYLSCSAAASGCERLVAGLVETGGRVFGDLGKIVSESKDSYSILGIAICLNHIFWGGIFVCQPLVVRI